MFPQRLHIPELGRKDIEDLVYYKIFKNGYSLTKKAQERLQGRIRTIISDSSNAVEEANDLVSDVIEKIETRNADRFINKAANELFKVSYTITSKEI